MSQAIELLNTLAEEGTQAYTTLGETEPHIVVNADRTIVVPPELRRLAVQYDHNVETVTFDCPRYWDEHDLSTMKIYVIFALPNGTLPNIRIVNDVCIDAENESMMHFSWRIDHDITSVQGSIRFLICAVTVDENGAEVERWHSEINSECYISQGMKAYGNGYPQEVIDIVTLLLQRVEGIKTGYDIAMQRGFEGTEEEWLLSLIGPKGDPFTYADFTEEQLASLIGPQGEPLTFDDLTPEQRDLLRGDPFTYEDFTPEQLEGLRGPQGEPGGVDNTALDQHKGDHNNPHGVTAAQVGAAPAPIVSQTDITAGEYALAPGQSYHVYK